MTYYLVRTRNNSRIVEKQVNRVHMMILMKEINVDSVAVGAREEFFMTIILSRWLKFGDSYDRDNMILKKLMKYNNNLGPSYCLKENARKFAPTAPIASKFCQVTHDSSLFYSLSCCKTPLPWERIKGRKCLQLFLSEAIEWTLAWAPRYRWKIATRPETQITHTRGGRQSLVDVNTRERKQREQETVSHSECE